MPDVSFEHRFSRLAEAQLSEKLPLLMEHRVGFQTLSTNDDESWAVGVYVFLVNKLWVYVPVIFSRGRLKGFDHMYIKQQDLFIPSQDNWVAVLESEGISELGGTLEDDEDLADFSEADMALIGEEVGSKLASLGQNTWVDPDVFQKMASIEHSSDYTVPTLKDALIKLGAAAAGPFLNTVLHNPDFANACLQAYDVAGVEDLMYTCVRAQSVPTLDVAEKVAFYTELDESSRKLSSKEKQLLMKHGAYVKDERGVFSTVFEDSLKTGVLSNPPCPGFYEVLMHDGKTKDCMILFGESIAREEEARLEHEELAGSFLSADRPMKLSNQVFLVDLATPKQYVSVASNKIHARPMADPPKESQGGTVATKSNVMERLKSDTGMLMVRDASEVVEFEPRLGGPYGGTSVSVEFVGESGCVTITGDTLFVPKGTVLFEENPDLASDLGTLEQVEQFIHEEAGVKRVELSSDDGGDTVTIKYDGEPCSLLDKTGALKELVLRHGVFAGLAQRMLKEASTSRGKGYFIKHAAVYDPTRPTSIPHREEGNPIETNDEVGGRALSGTSGEEDMLPDDVIRRATEAASTGVQEVFDVTVLQGLVDAADVSGLQREFLVDIVRGMDKLGRMLFILYWHTEDFEEKFGRDDMDSLESTLRNLFHETGDLVLYLREKGLTSPDAGGAVIGEMAGDIAT